MIYGHPVIAATRALRFSDHVTKRNGDSEDENAFTQLCWTRACAQGPLVAFQGPGAHKHPLALKMLKMLRVFGQPIQHMLQHHAIML